MGVPAAWRELEIDDLPSDDLRWIAEEFGLDTALSIWHRCAGTPISFPKNLPKAFCLRYLQDHFSGHNAPQLARTLGISLRTVQEYLGSRPVGRIRREDPAQLSLI